MSTPPVTAPATGKPTANSRWALDIAPEASGSYTPLRGMNNFTPAINDTVQDASDYDSDGWGSDAITQRKWQNQGSVMRKEYAGAYDPGQEILRQAAWDKTLIRCRWYERGVTAGEAYEGLALVQWNPQGGDTTGLGTVNFTLLGQGAPQKITTPEGPGE